MASPQAGITLGPQSLRIDISTISRFFRGVSVANYFLLTGCGNLLVGALIIVWTVNSVGEFIGIAICTFVCGFGAWVGWRNIGILNAVVHKYTSTALLLLSVFSSIMFIVLVPQVFGSTEASYRAINAVMLFMFLALSSAAGLLALFVLHRLSLSGLNVKLRDFLLDSSPAPYKHRSTKPLSAVKGYAFLALGLLWIFGMSLIPDELLPKELVKQLWRVSQVAFLFLIYARHFLRPDFQTIVASDTRPPVLFLRSFEDDEKLDYQRADSALFDFSLESRLADQYSSLGPFIAVGKPGDKMPHLGAARASLSDDEWQGTVKEWMGRSALIILMIGRTQWIDWELRRIIELGYIAKLMIVFPQVRRPTWTFFSWRAKRMKDAEARLTVVRKAFVGTPWETGLCLPGSEAVKPQNLRSLAFLPGGEVVAVTSRPRNRESYHLAALIARNAQLRAQDATAVIPASASVSVPSRKRRWMLALLGTATAGIALWSLIATQGAGLFRDSPPEPLPEDLVLKSTGSMKAENFQFVDPATSEVRSNIYHPGDQLAFVYEVTGMGIDSTGTADVTSNASLVDSDENAASGASATRFRRRIGAKGRIRFTFKTDLFTTTKPADYRIDIKLHDVISNADFEFRPLIHVQATSR